MTDLQMFDGDTNAESEMLAAFDQIPFGNSAFQVKQMVLDELSPQRKYRKVLLQMKEKYMALKKAEFRYRRLEIELDDLRSQKQTPLIEIDIEEKLFDLDMEKSLVDDAIAELNLYYAIYKGLRKELGEVTRDQFEASEPEYWRERAVKQAELDILATGRISQGNADLLLQAGRNPYNVLHEVSKGSQKLLKQLEANSQKD